MIDLQLDAFDLDIRSHVYGGFRYLISFYLRGKPYGGEGVCPSPTQCFDAAMAYLAECVRSADVEAE